MSTHQSANDDTKPGVKSAAPESRLDTARNATTDAFAAAREKVGTVVGEVSEKVGGALGDAREQVGRAADTARETAGSASRKAVDGIQENPVAALVGGLALGAIAAALLPRTQREIAAFGALGTRINDAAKGAAVAAKDAGRDKLGELGLTRTHAQDTVSKLFADVAKAATSAGTAAVGSVKKG